MGGFAKHQGLVGGKESRQRGAQGWVRRGYPSPKMACTLSDIPNSNILQIKRNTVTSVCLIAPRDFFFFFFPPSRPGCFLL